MYKTNQELIDHHLANASKVVNQQTQQVKQLASQHASRAVETTKAYASDYSSKAQEAIRTRSVSPITQRTPATTTNGTKEKEFASSTNGIKEEPAPAYQASDFPAAPKQDLQQELPTVDIPAHNVAEEFTSEVREEAPLIAS